MGALMKKSAVIRAILGVVLCCIVSLAGDVSSMAAEEAPAAWMQSSLESLAKGSSQVLLVVGEESSGFTATVYALEKRGNSWRNAFTPLPALIGKNGFAPPGEKKEGDVRTPSGVFTLKRAFGYAAEIATRLSYRQAGDDDIWVDDAASPDYNHWVRRDETSAASFENMKLEDDRYKYGIVIEYNTDPVVKGAGSAIFIHVRRGENMPTMGCVALSEGDIQKVLAWLDPQANPRAIMGTEAAIISLTTGEQKRRLNRVEK
jgi:L,D-peptidoglycan transpeptidase YkuD (ErfK/YbiS/YcfS/YnhG family)